MLLIQFELGGSNRDDKRLIEAIGALGATARLMRSTFLVDSLLNAQQAYGVLEDLIEKGTDRMLVIEVNPANRQGWLPKPVWDFLGARVKQG